MLHQPNITITIFYKNKQRKLKIRITTNELDTSKDKAKEHTTLCQLAPNVRDPTLTKDKTNLSYINGGNPHLASRFCRVELGFKSTLVSEPILVRFIEPIVSPAIGTLSN